MPRRNPIFKEGDWFTLPLKRGYNALGLVARVDRRGHSFLGYYFPHPDLDVQPERLSPRDAALICASGDYGFAHDAWKVIRSSEDWRRENWPIPCFERIDFFWPTALRNISRQ